MLQTMGDGSSVMKKITLTAAVLLISAGFSFGGDTPADGNAEARTRNSGEISIDRAWAVGNPALVGLESQSQTRLSLFPTSIALWNDKVSLPMSNMSSMKSWVAALMRESFGISKGLSPDEASQKLTDELRDGIYFYAGARSAPVDFAARNFGFSVKTFADADLKLPGGLFMPFFSATDGLLAGNTLDLSAARVSEIWATEIGVKYGRGIAIPFISDYLWLDEGAAGVGVKALIGHNYFGVEANENCEIYYDPVSNKYKTGMALDVVSAQSGYGWGVDLGTVFHNDNHAFSIDVQNIGMIKWSGQKVRRGKVAIGELDLNGGGSDFFDVGSLTPGGKDYVMPLPTSLNAGYLYYADLSAFYGNGLGALLNYVSAGLCYNQQLVPGPGKNTYAPRFSAGAKLGFMGGYLPVRYGIIVGGSEKLASTAGVELGKHGSFGIYYKAAGSPILWPKKGLEIAFNQTTVWGGKSRARDKRKTPPPVQPVDTASAASAQPEVEEAAVDTASAVKKAAVDTTAAPRAVPEKAVDTTSTHHTVPAKAADTTTAPHTASEKAVDTTATHHTVPEKAVDTTAAPHTVPGKAVDTTTAPHIAPEKAVDTTAAPHNVPAKAVDTATAHHTAPAETVDTAAAHHTVPVKTVDTTATRHNTPVKTVDTTAVHHNVPAKAIDTTAAQHTVPAKAVDTAAVHHTVPAKTIDTAAVHHNAPAKTVDTTAAQHIVPAKAVDTAAVHHNVPAKTADTTSAPAPEVKKSSEESKSKAAAPPAVKKDAAAGTPSVPAPGR